MKKFSVSIVYLLRQFCRHRRQEDEREWIQSYPSFLCTVFWLQIQTKKRIEKEKDYCFVLLSLLIFRMNSLLIHVVVQLLSLFLLSMLLFLSCCCFDFLFAFQRWVFSLCFKLLISSPWFYLCCVSCQILRYVECFCGPNIMAMHTQWLNHSLAQFSRIEDVPLHQNLFSLPFRPTERILCLWAPLEQTGPLTTGGQSQQQSFVLIPGSHKSSQLLTIDSDETLIYEPLPAAVDATTVRKQLSLDAGDVVLYHPLLSHATFSSPSSTAGSISTFFASSDCQYVEYLHGRDDSLIPSHLKSISSMSVCPEVIKFLRVFLVSKRLTCLLLFLWLQNRWKDYGVLVKGIRSSL